MHRSLICLWVLNDFIMFHLRGICLNLSTWNLTITIILEAWILNGCARGLSLKPRKQQLVNGKPFYFMSSLRRKVQHNGIVRINLFVDGLARTSAYCTFQYLFYSNTNYVEAKNSELLTRRSPVYHQPVRMRSCTTAKYKNQWDNWTEFHVNYSNRPFRLVHFVFPFQTTWCPHGNFPFVFFISYA